MSELQAAEAPGAVDQPTEQPEVEPVDTGAELATDSPEVGEQNTDSAPAMDPAGYTKAINKQHYKFQEQKRETDSVRREFEEFKAKHAPAPVKNVEIPALLDPYEEGYAKSLKARDDALQQNARNDAVTAQNEEASARADRQVQIDNANASKDRIEGFRGNAKRLGVSDDAYGKAIGAIAAYGVSVDIENQLLEDSDGPIIAQYLEANPLEMEALNNATPIGVGLMWAELKSKAAALKPTATKAALPATAVSGGGMPPKTLGPPGATFD